VTSTVPAPTWFSDYRSRVLAAWVALGALGSTLVWLASYLTTGSPIFGLLSIGGVVTVGVLVFAAHTGGNVSTRKGAGLAMLLHIARLAALAWQLVLPTEPHTKASLLALVGTGLVVIVLLLQAGWLHWVAALPRAVS
jgi:hypothetical protein